MNYTKIGEFIANERKAKKLTQAKFAEQLCVSEKTVSKWETGRGLPDTNLLLKLCKILNVGLNELLSGERQTVENPENEELLLNMAQELEQKTKTIWKTMWIIMIISFVTFFLGITISALLVSPGIWQLVCIIAFTIMFLIPCFFALTLEVSVGGYKCKHCGHKIVPTYSQALWAMHKGTTRYLKCPKCGKHSWCKKILK